MYVQQIVVMVSVFCEYEEGGGKCVQCWYMNKY